MAISFIGKLYGEFPSAGPTKRRAPKSRSEGDFPRLSYTNIKEMLFGSLIERLCNQIIIQAVTKLISFFNLVGAIVQALQAIYNIAMFFKERWEQIKSFAQSVFQSFTNIASGNVSGAAGFIEGSLGKAIPIMIAFLARLLNIGGIVQKVKDVIGKIKKPVRRIPKCAMKMKFLFML